MFVLVFLVLAFLMYRLRSLHRETEAALSDLGARMRLQERQMDVLWRGRLATRPAVTESGPATEPVRQPEPKPAPEPAPEPVRYPTAAPTAAVAAASPVPPPLPEPSRWRPERDQAGWEALIGGNLLNKLGALVLVIGIALFLGHSFTNMGPGGRAASGAALGLAILAGGVRLERVERYRVFSRGLIAAGWASLYLTAYAMWAVPATQVIQSATAGTALMVAVAAGMVLHSLRYRVESLTALAFGCVFAALGLGDLTALTAIAIVPLAISLLYLAARFDWTGLAVFGAAASYVTFVTRESSGSTLLAVQGMLLVYWLLFEAYDVWRITAAEEPNTPLGQALFGVNAAGGLLASAAVWYRMRPDAMWQFCAGAALLYLLSSAMRMAFRNESRYEHALALAALLAGLGIFAEVPGVWKSLGTILEAEALFLAGLYLGIRWARGLSRAAFAASLIGLAWHWDAGVTNIIGGLTVDQWAPPLAILALVFYVNRFLAPASLYFGYGGAALIAVLAGCELPWRFAGAGWLVAGALLFEFGVARLLADFRMQGYALAILGAAGSLFAYLDPLHRQSPWTHGTGLALALALGVRAVGGALSALPESERRALRLGGAVGAAAMAGLLMGGVVPAPYVGLATILAALVLMELALRGWPPELATPASTLAATGFFRLLAEHLPAMQKQPETGTAIAVSASAAAFFALTARLALASERDDLEPARIAAPWLGTGLACVSIWMLLPDAWVPVAMAAFGLALVEAGLSRHGRAAALVAGACAFDVGRWYWPSVVAVTMAHWLLWYRHRHSTSGSAAAHGWVAVALVAWTTPAAFPHDYLLAYGIQGVAIAAAVAMGGPRTLRDQGAALAAFSVLVFLTGDTAWPQAAAVCGWFLAAVALGGRAAMPVRLRSAYSVALALVAAVAVYREVSGGLLTLSWSAEGIALLAAGFLLRERALRLSGLALLLGCIGKVFLYDLRNLETVFRILSFIGLGAMLLAVSWLYTRFKDELQKYL